MEKISICITYYNQEPFVRDSLESVLDIDFPCDYEILCGDDGSSDNTVNILKEYQNKYPDIIKIFQNKKKETSKSINRASLNRLNLLSHATGDYLLFLDGDDFYCDKNFVKDAINTFNNNDNIVATAFNFKYFYKDYSEKNFSQNINEGIVSVKDYVSNVNYIHSGAIIFKNIIDEDKLNLLKQVNNFDDNGITIYFLQFGDLYYLNRPVYSYRQTKGSMWTDMSEAEQNLINAMDYKLICDVAPSLSRYVAKRQYLSIKYIFKNRKVLKEKLNDKFEKYLNISKQNNDTFMYNLLRWYKLNFIQKCFTYFKWKSYKGQIIND